MSAKSPRSRTAPPTRAPPPAGPSLTPPRPALKRPRASEPASEAGEGGRAGSDAAAAAAPPAAPEPAGPAARVSFARRPGRDVGRADAAVDRTPWPLPNSCDGCGRFVVGRRWSCGACAADAADGRCADEFDLCEACHEHPPDRAAAHVHPLAAMRVLADSEPRGESCEESGPGFGSEPAQAHAEPAALAAASEPAWEGAWPESELLALAPPPRPAADAQPL